ncbi:MAG TPA: WhiB family transcriptional regulator [Nitriliruptorales bacterium]
MTLSVEQASRLVDQPFAGGGWQEEAACRSADIELFFSTEDEDQRAALEHCRSCTVQQECLVDAIENREMYGIWGGMPESERRSIIRDVRRREHNGGERDKRSDAA